MDTYLPETRKYGFLGVCVLRYPRTWLQVQFFWGGSTHGSTDMATGTYAFTLAGVRGHVVSPDTITSTVFHCTDPGLCMKLWGCSADMTASTVFLWGHPRTDPQTWLQVAIQVH